MKARVLSPELISVLKRLRLGRVLDTLPGIRCNSPMAVSVARCWEPRRHAHPDGPPGPLQIPSHPDP